MLDIIIINHNSHEYLYDCLSSIDCNKNGLKTTVSVIDNGSNDRIDFIRNCFPTANIIHHKENLGYSKAINNFLKITYAPYIVLLNPDTFVLSDGFLEVIAAYMEKQPNIGILGPRVLDPDGSIQGSARSFPGWHSLLFGRKSLLTRLLPNCRFTYRNILTNNAPARDSIDVDWISGACMVVRREALRDVGLLDERFFLYWEDVDWCKRMWSAGWKVKYYPLVSLIHYVGGSSESNILHSIIEFHKSAFQYFNKYVFKHRVFIMPLIFAGMLFRFTGIVLLQSIRRSIFRFKKIKSVKNITMKKRLYKFNIAENTSKELPN